MNIPPLTVTTPTASYPIYVGQQIAQALPQYLDACGLHGALWLISDHAVYGHHGAAVEHVLRVAGYAVQSYSVPAGEGSKDLNVAARLYDWLIGAFHQPRLVVSDTAMLATLPPRELRAGWAEVIKHGMIRDAGLCELLEATPSTFSGTRVEPVSQASPTLAGVIRRAAKVKVDIVNADEREQGERMLLNYGHTLGHALEAAAGYGRLLHGEAVAIGMHLAAQIARQLGLIGAELVERQQRLLHAYGLSTTIPAGIEPAHLLDLTLRDKKVRAGRVRWVLPTAIGGATVCADVPEALVRAVVEANTP